MTPTTWSRRRILLAGLSGGLVLGAGGGTALGYSIGSPVAASSPSDVDFTADDVVDLAYYVSDLCAVGGLTPLMAARFCAYSAILINSAAYGVDLTGIVHDWPATPDRPAEVDVATAVATALSVAIPILVPFAASPLLFLTRNHALAIIQSRRQSVSASLMDASQAFGQQMGLTIGQWSSLGNLQYDADFISNGRPNSWAPRSERPQDRAVDAHPENLHPIFLAELSTFMPASPPIEYSESTGSDFFQQATEVFDTSQRLNSEQKEISRFWADQRDATGTPSVAFLKLVDGSLS